MKLGRRLVAVAATIVLGTPLAPLHAAAAPAGYPISGIDVSAYQGTVDWAAVAAGGAKFAYIRASDSTPGTWPTRHRRPAGRGGPCGSTPIPPR